jgi:hypothetical protein
MPTNKDFKRLVRRRMQKTGESYTAARAHLLEKPHQPHQPRPAREPRPAAYATLAGMSDAAVKAKTGCTWERWVQALDRVQAHTWSHREIARHVAARYKTPSWWAQMVTVGYERIRGLREIGQRRGGLFQARKTKTVAVPVHRLYRAFKDPRTRARWLPGVGLKIRTAIPSKSARVTWHDGTSLEAYFAPKGGAKSQVVVQHGRLPTREVAAQMKRYWEERLDVLVTLLTKSAGRERSAPISR